MLKTLFGKNFGSSREVPADNTSAAKIDLGRVRTLIEFFPIGKKLRYYPEFNKDIVLDTLIVAASARPEAGKRMLQRLGFADAGKGLALDRTQKAIDAVEQGRVDCLPVAVVFPGFVGEDQLHLASSRSLPCPAASRATAESRRFALTGEWSNLAVSSRAL